MLTGNKVTSPDIITVQLFVHWNRATGGQLELFDVRRCIALAAECSKLPMQLNSSDNTYLLVVGYSYIRIMLAYLEQKIKWRLKNWNFCKRFWLPSLHLLDRETTFSVEWLQVSPWTGAEWEARVARKGLRNCWACCWEAAAARALVRTRAETEQPSRSVWCHLMSTECL